MRQSEDTESVREVETLIGRRVRIQAIKEEGSARLLNGLTGVVIGPHPIAPNWCKLLLDANSITPHRSWSIALEHLVPV